MKKIVSVLSLVMLFLSATLVSCKKDDKNASIIGNWKMVKSDDKGIYQGRPYADVYEYDETDFMEFKENGEYRRYGDNNNYTGTWTLAGNKLTLYNRDWEETYTFTINKLTNSELVYIAREDYDNGDYDESVYHLTR